MDVVIPYKESAAKGFELRYTLRGIDKYFPDLENIFIIGDCPLFLHNIIHIPAADAPQRHLKARNIMSKLLLACGDKRVSDHFAFFNDDHFLLKPWQMSFHHCGSLENSLRRYTAHQTYKNTLQNTYDVLKGGVDFDTHSPIVYWKETFIRVINRVDWSKHWGYGIKSLYCNLAGIEGELYPDLKLKAHFSYDTLRNLIIDRQYFSIDDRAINNDLLQIFNELYPQKSIYEFD
jgi:hypothetical protein